MLNKNTTFLLFFILCLLVTQISYAQDLPGSADPDRLLKNSINRPVYKNDMQARITVNEGLISRAPDGSEKIFFRLNSVNITGLAAFDLSEFESLYLDKIGKKVPVSFLWMLANQITAQYREHGYFLSKAYVPNQEIDTGNIVINVIEGHISEVEVDGPSKNDVFVKKIKRDIIDQRPTKLKLLESQLLRLGDLYGIKYIAVLGKKPNSKEGDVILTLKQIEEDPSRASLSFNNYGSRFIGPHRASLNYEKSFIDYHNTALSILSIFPTSGELYLGSLNHRIQVSPEFELDFLFSNTNSEPGSSLEEREIDSNSLSLGLGLEWIPIRQRHKNLKLFSRIDMLNSHSDTFSNALTRDRIRSFRMGLDYEFIDQFLGFNNTSVTLSKGLTGLGASNKGDLNLSRADADPGFGKIEAQYTRQSFLDDGSILFRLDTKAQVATGALFSSEEFGYGGIDIGRAYDFSEITGDHGFSVLMNIMYTGLPSYKKFKPNPFIFYDFGKVWNSGNTSVKSISGSSAGFGVNIDYDRKLNFDLSVAFPLTKEIDNSLYGFSQGPVIRFGLTKYFDLNLPEMSVLPEREEALSPLRSRVLEREYNDSLRK